ncbi:MAG: glycosyltransferase family protein [Negativicutes bacterium]|nr:glycosyltransferase family protein [Negativicutes bacterium]
MPKICFISCLNDKVQYATCLSHINNLTVPDGFTVETIALDDAKSLASGYNRALKQTDAEYKVYIHQDTYIINKNFIQDIVDLFASDPKIGLLGVVGAYELPLNGMWGSAKKKYGKVIVKHDGQVENFFRLEVVGACQEVRCVDGLLIVTRYDLPWREDLFDGWHFYDISQCLEFQRKKHAVCIPRQDEPWCIHDCKTGGDPSPYHYYRDIFMREYAKDMYFFGYLPVLVYNWNRKLRPFLKAIETQVKKLRKISQ